MSYEQLHAASRQFPKSFIDTKQGASYVEHSVITQRLMEVFGFYDMVNVELIRGYVPAWIDKRDEKKNKPALEDAVTGVLLTLRVHTRAGDYPTQPRPVVITEVGEVEFPHNHTTDASRAKHATSDAIKRCAMRLGIGLHLWAGGHYYLDRKMDAIMADGDDTDEVPDAPRPDDKPVDPDDPTVDDTVDDTPEPATEADLEAMLGAERVDDETTERMDVLTDLLKHFPDDFVATLDTDRMYAYADESDENLKVAIDLVEQKHQMWEAEHDADEELSVPAPGFFFHKGGGHYVLYDKEGFAIDTVQGKGKVPDGYAELEQQIEQVEVVEEGHDQPPAAPGDGSKSFGEELDTYPVEFVAWLREQGVNLDSMERHAERNDEMRVNALKIISNRWREYQQEKAA